MHRTTYSLDSFFSWLKESTLADYGQQLQKDIYFILEQKKNGRLNEWKHALVQLPKIKSSSYSFDSDVISIKTETKLTAKQKEKLHNSLKLLCPWRKGPFDFFGEYIDTEWRSHLKWNRLKNHISLKGKLVADVGCGSGYHMWRMLGKGASRIIGLDPSILFFMQFQAFKNYTETNLPIDLLPLPLEDFPYKSEMFDTVFAMGVLYHRKDPIGHLFQLLNLLKKSGELVLETLIVEGTENTILMPKDRYAMMSNVWFIPSVQQLLIWLNRVGFTNCKVIDISKTTTYEQRKTEWIPGSSFENFLDKKNENLTIEGYPAPQRAIIKAHKK